MPHLLRTLCLLLTLLPAILWAQQPDGAVIIRVPDGVNSRCINGKKDVIWLTLRRLVTSKSHGWFTKDTEVALLTNAVVLTSPPAGEPTTFPLMTQTKFDGYADGQVSLPIEYTLVNEFALRDSKTRYSGLRLELTLLNKRGRNAWGKGIELLGKLAKDLPIPANPASESARYLLDFTNGIVNDDLKTQDSGDQAKSAALALNFDPTGACAGGNGFESTGTLAILQEKGADPARHVPIGSTNDYCWSADLKPAFVLKAAKRAAGARCDDLTQKLNYFQVSNNYTAFVLSAVEATKDLAGPPKEDLDAAQARCAVNGLTKKKCM